MFSVIYNDYFSQGYYQCKRDQTAGNAIIYYISMYCVCLCLFYWEHKFTQFSYLFKVSFIHHTLNR